MFPSMPAKKKITKKEKKEIFLCGECGKVFYEEEQLYDHLIRKHGKN
jgi:uncharacterized C2H2 Zn-finger protein